MSHWTDGRPVCQACSAPGARYPARPRSHLPEWFCTLAPPAGSPRVRAGACGGIPWPIGETGGRGTVRGPGPARFAVCPSHSPTELFAGILRVPGGAPCHAARWERESGLVRGAGSRVAGRRSGIGQVREVSTRTPQEEEDQEGRAAHSPLTTTQGIPLGGQGGAGPRSAGGARNRAAGVRPRVAPIHRGWPPGRRRPDLHHPGERRAPRPPHVWGGRQLPA